MPAGVPTMIGMSPARFRRREGSMMPMVMVFMTFVLLMGFMVVKVVLIKGVQRSAAIRAQQAALTVLTTPPVFSFGEVPTSEAPHRFYPKITQEDVRFSGDVVTVRQRVNFPGVAPVLASAKAVPAASIPPGVLRGVAPLAMDVEKVPDGEWISLKKGALRVIAFEGKQFAASDYLPYLTGDDASLLVAPPELSVGDAVYDESRPRREAFLSKLMTLQGEQSMVVALTRGHRVVGFCRMVIAETDADQMRLRLAPASPIVPQGIPQVPAGTLAAESFSLPPSFGPVLAPQLQTRRLIKITPFMESSSPNSLRVTLIHHDAGTLQQIQDDLAHESLSHLSLWTSSNVVQGHQTALDVAAHVVLLDLDSDRDLSLEAIPNFVAAGVKVICLSNPILNRTGQVELVRDAVRKGAFDFLDLPLQRPDVLAAFQRLQGEAEVAQQESPEGRAFGVLGLKGGVGSTTIALNLAAALADGGKKKVAFVDGCLQFGDAAAMQGLEITRTLLDAEGDWDASTTRLEHWLDRDPRTQVYFLHRPASMRDADSIDPQRFTRILVRLLRMVDYLVVDLPSRLDLFTFSAMEVCERTVLVADPKPATVDRALAFRESLSELGLLPQRLVWAVNRPTKVDLDYGMKDGASIPGLSSVFDFPNEPKLSELYGTGGTSVLDRSKTGFARDLMRLAGSLEGGRA